MNRHESREQAFVFLFESTFGMDNIDEIIELAKISRNIEVSDFARRLFMGVKTRQIELDERIEKYLKQWKKSRLSRVTISILRLAVYEMLFEDDIPVSVSINEAVELGKKYSNKENATYINGVLGALSKDINKGCEKSSEPVEKSDVMNEQC